MKIYNFLTGGNTIEIQYGKHLIIYVTVSNSALRCIIKISQYPGECKRVFTDGGAHSAIPTNKDNITVFDNCGNITRIYNYEYPTGIDFDKYCDIYQKQNIFGMTVA